MSPYKVPPHVTCNVGGLQQFAPYRTSVGVELCLDATVRTGDGCRVTTGRQILHIHGEGFATGITLVREDVQVARDVNTATITSIPCRLWIASTVSWMVRSTHIAPSFP